MVVISPRRRIQSQTRRPHRRTHKTGYGPIFVIAHPAFLSGKKPPSSLPTLLAMALVSFRFIVISPLTFSFPKSRFGPLFTYSDAFLQRGKLLMRQVYRHAPARTGDRRQPVPSARTLEWRPDKRGDARTSNASGVCEQKSCCW